MIAARDMDDDYEDYEDFENDDEEQKNARRSARKSAENRGGPGSGPRAGAGSVSKEKDAAESAKTTEEHIAAAKYHTDESMHKHGDDMDKSVKHGQAAMAHLKAAVSGKEKDSEIAHEYSKAARSENKATELRDDDSSKVRTKMVGGKALPAGAFAVVGDPNDTSTWKLPIHDKAHADNAAARLNQTDDIDKEAADKKIKAAQKKFGESPDDARAFKEQMELRFRLSMLATEIQ
jgi:hypothetical protein